MKFLSKKIPEYAHVVEANTTPNFEAKSKKIDNIDIKETSVKEANLLAREAINLISNFGIGNVISSDDLDKDVEEANIVVAGIPAKKISDYGFINRNQI